MASVRTFGAVLNLPCLVLSPTPASPQQGSRTAAAAPPVFSGVPSSHSSSRKRNLGPKVRSPLQEASRLLTLPLQQQQAPMVPRNSAARSGAVVSAQPQAPSYSKVAPLNPLQQATFLPSSPLLQQPWMAPMVFVARRGAIVSAQSQASSASSSSTSNDATLNAKPTETTVAIAFKHILLPIIDRNPYLSEATRQAIATTTSLAKQYGADVTVAVIDHREAQDIARGDSQEANDKHSLKLETIRWHLNEGGCADYKVAEKLAEGQMPAAAIGEMADDLGLDLVIISMESIHHKHIDGNLLVEFVPCPILMLPL